MSDNNSFQGGSSLSSHSKCLRTAELLAACMAIGGCSLGDFSYLQEGSAVKGGTHSSDTSGGNDAKGGEDSGGTSNNSETQNASGGSSAKTSGGTSSTGGSSSSPCEAGRSQCGEPAVCVDLTLGMSSGSTVENCGACGTKCSLTNATSATCTDSKCHSTCNSGFADCNYSNANDGCETDVSTTTKSCGACARACASTGVQSLSCSAGKCNPTCLPKHFDCKQDTGEGADDGCETTLDSLTSCGTSCDDRATCNPTQVCNEGRCGAPQGIIELSIPFSKSGQAQRYAEKFALPDLTGSSLILRMYAPEGANEVLRLYLVDADYTAGASGLDKTLAALSQGWTDVVIPVGAASGSYDPTAISQLNIEILANGSGPWRDPTLIYIDRIWSTNGVIDDTFTKDTNFVMSQSLSVTGSKYEALTVMP